MHGGEDIQGHLLGWKKMHFFPLGSSLEGVRGSSFLIFTWVYKSRKWQMYKVSVGAYASPLLNV